MRYHAPLQLRQRSAVCAGAYLDLVFAYPGRPGSQRPGASEAVGGDFTPALREPYRWQDWAAPHADDPNHPRTPEGEPFGWKRQEMFAKGDGRLFDFINTDLLPYLHGLDMVPKTGLPNPSTSPKQRIIGRIMTAVERVRVDSETNLRDILDKVHEISIEHIDDTHFSPFPKPMKTCC